MTMLKIFTKELQLGTMRNCLDGQKTLILPYWYWSPRIGPRCLYFELNQPLFSNIDHRASKTSAITWTILHKSCANYHGISFRTPDFCLLFWKMNSEFALTFCWSLTWLSLHYSSFLKVQLQNFFLHTYLQDIIYATF